MRVKGGQPLNRASLVSPFCERLEAGGADLDAVLEAVGLSREIISDPDVFVPAATIYAFCEEAAKALGDPLLGVRIGLSLSRATWRPQREAAEGADTLVEYFTRFILLVGQHAGATRYELHVADPMAHLRYTRQSEVDAVPAQVTAMGIGSMIALLRSALGDAFDPHRVVIQTPAPEAVFAPAVPGISFIRGDGDTIYTFPAEWLVARLSGGFNGVRRAASRPPAGILDALRALQRSRIGEGTLSINSAAGLLGMPRHALRAALRARGLTYRAVLDQVFREDAMEALSRGSGVSATAARLGYENVANFTRAFRRWTGETPSEFARRRGSD